MISMTEEMKSLQNSRTWVWSNHQMAGGL